MLSKPCDLLEKLVFIWTLKNTNIHSQLKCTFFFRININHGKFGTFLNAFWKFVFFFICETNIKISTLYKIFPVLSEISLVISEIFPVLSEISPVLSEIFLILPIQKSVSVLYQTYYSIQAIERDSKTSLNLMVN